MATLRSRLPELHTIEALVARCATARCHVLEHVEYGGELFPIHCLELGCSKRSAPTLTFVAGVHGDDRAGTQLIVAYIEALESSLDWDEVMSHLLETVRLVFIPLINPVGMALGQRANGHGVTLTRNAPVQAEGPDRWYRLERGQQLSAWLPWFRGSADSAMEAELHALCAHVRRDLFSSRLAVTVEVRARRAGPDRICFPYARSKYLFPGAPEVMALKQMMRQSWVNHPYRLEPQSHLGTYHGDLWDYLYDDHLYRAPKQTFLPFVFEPKLPRASTWRSLPALAGRFGATQPVATHLRRHQPCFDFFLRAVYSHHTWLPRAERERAALLRQAQLRWHPPLAPL